MISYLCHYRRSFFLIGFFWRCLLQDPTCVICKKYLYLSAISCRCRRSAFVCLEVCGPMGFSFQSFIIRKFYFLESLLLFRHLLKSMLKQKIVENDIQKPESKSRPKKTTKF